MSKNKVSIIGYIVGLTLFLVITLFLSDRGNLGCGHCAKTYGFPFEALVYEVFSDRADILWFGLFANGLVAFSFTLAIGVVFKIAWLKFLESKLK